MQYKICAIFYLLFILINAGPIACGVVCSTCCSAQWFWVYPIIPACIASCVIHYVPAPIPPIPTPVDLGAICQIAGLAAALLPTP